jgi:phenylacetate-CoA oxygenase PaaJ subunit
MQALWDVLAEVPDPEIPAVSVVELGIVARRLGGAGCHNPTYSGCPATLFIEQSIRAALDAAGYRSTAIQTVISPPWTTEWITPEGREKLRRYGIAPPEPSARFTARNAAARTRRSQPLRLHSVQEPVGAAATAWSRSTASNVTEVLSRRIATRTDPGAAFCDRQAPARPSPPPLERPLIPTHGFMPPPIPIAAGRA